MSVPGFITARWLARYSALVAGLFVSVILGFAPDAHADKSITLDCAGEHAADCAAVLPGATRFAKVTDDAVYLTGFDGDDEIVGWVILSTDTVDIKGYSSHPLITLVGLSPEAKITGARVIHHSEPILLVGIPTQALTDFVDRYRGVPAITKVVVGSSRDPDAMTVDVISGATVTALAENQTILETARHLGVATGVIAATSINPGSFVQGERPWTWQEMVEGGVLGRLTVRESEVGVSSSEGIFLDLYFTIADAPHIGRALLGEREYAYQMGRLAEDEHLVIMLGNGSTSFKGSGFVRGGIFDRVRIEQGLQSVIFRDRDYSNLSGASAEGAPDFREGAVFVAREGRLDPGKAYDVIFLGSRYDGRGGFSRDFNAFKSTHRLPKSVYEVTGGDRDLGRELADQAWYNQRYEVGLLIFILLLVAGFFVARRWLTKSMRRVHRVHTATLVVSFVVLGLILQAQPSITQVLTLIGSAVGEFDFNLFLTEPVLFVFWIFIAIVLIIWGRGVFCGWTCPYGALSELLFKIGQKIGLKPFELPERIHKRARYIRYGVLAALIPIYLWSPQTGEQLAEIEPFKTTFFVPVWNREAIFVLWWLILLIPAFFWFRPFCRYICPLGAALAIPGSLRISGPHRRQFCDKCKICTKGCEPKAFRDDGSIDPRECLSCMECEVNYHDVEVCPPLVALERLSISGNPRPEKLIKLQAEAQWVRRPGRRKAE